MFNQGGPLFRYFDGTHRDVFFFSLCVNKFKMEFFWFLKCEKNII